MVCVQDKWPHAKKVLSAQLAHAPFSPPPPRLLKSLSESPEEVGGGLSMGSGQPLAAAHQLPGVLSPSQDWMDSDFSINPLLHQEKEKCAWGGAGKWVIELEELA